VTKMLLSAALAAAVMVSGCASTRSSGGTPAGDASVSLTSKPLEGVVMVKTDGMYVYYRNKCESCGHVESKVHRLLGPSKGKAIVSAFLCEKCGKAQKITIMGQ